MTTTRPSRPVVLLRPVPGTSPAQSGRSTQESRPGAAPPDVRLA